MRSSLTTRERQVMTLLAQGRLNREVAEELKISIKTVDTHRSNVLKKLKLRNNAELARYAIKHRVIDVDGNELSGDWGRDSNAIPSSEGFPCG